MNISGGADPRINNEAIQQGEEASNEPTAPPPSPNQPEAEPSPNQPEAKVMNEIKIEEAFGMANMKILRFGDMELWIRKKENQPQQPQLHCSIQ